MAVILNNSLTPDGSFDLPTSPYAMCCNFQVLYVWGFSLSTITMPLYSYRTNEDWPKPTGALYFELYETANSGSPYFLNVPTGSPIATTDSVSQQSITLYEYADLVAIWPSALTGTNYTFTFDSQPDLSYGSVYSVVAKSTSYYIGRYFTAWNSTVPANYGAYGSAYPLRYGSGDSFYEIWSGRSLCLTAVGELGSNPVSPGVDSLPTYPPARPDGYAPDDIWIPGEWDSDTYTPPEWSSDPIDGRYFATGGGRWGQQLVVAGHNLVYYEELT